MEVSSNFKQIMKRESFSLFFRFTVTTMFLHLSKIQSSVTVSSTVKKHVFSQVYAITIECHITLHLTCCKKVVPFIIIFLQYTNCEIDTNKMFLNCVSIVIYWKTDVSFHVFTAISH